MRREIFGPILPIVTYGELEEVVEAINAGDRPLALYPFTRDAATRRLLIAHTRSGGVSVNDTILHVVQHDLPFGGNPRDRRTGVYYIRPFGWPVIECFLGDEGARMTEDMGPAAGFTHATDQLAALFGSGVRRSLHPLVASNWSRMTYVGGAYSHALPGHAGARQDLAR